jgi:Protein of unknown function (DUF4238)
MAGRTRRHHYVPKLHLAEFTIDGRRNGQIWEFDAEINSVRLRTPKTCGWAKNYYRVLSKGLDIETVEKTFSEVENRVAPILRDVFASSQLPTVETQEFHILLWHLALQYHRSPMWRNPPWADPAVDESTNHATHTLAETPNFYDHFLDLDWSLVVADPSLGPLVTSDSPVALIVEVSERPKHMQKIDGRYSEYVAVLSPTMAMVGSLGKKDRVVAADHATVERLRGVTISNAARYVYASTREIKFERPDGTLSTLDAWAAEGKPAALDLFRTEYRQ